MNRPSQLVIVIYAALFAYCVLLAGIARGADGDPATFIPVNGILVPVSDVADYRGLVPVVPRPTYTTYTYSSWQWSPIASYHAAVVKVKCPSGNFMSGALVKTGNTVGVLTARHGVDSNTTTIRLHNGQELTGSPTHTDKYGSDLAWIVLGSEAAAAIGTLPPLAIAARPPQPGDRLEVCGFGGQEAAFRHFYCQFRGFERFDGYITRTTGTFISGDSGGPILNDQHEVVSLVTGSEQNVGGQGVAICLNGYGPHWTHLSAFVGRMTETQGCPPGQQCPPGGCPPGQGQPGSFSPGFIRQGEIGIFRRRQQQPSGQQQPGGGFYPPQQPIPQPTPIDSLPPVLPTPRPEIPVPPPLPPQIDTGKLKTEIVGELKVLIEAAIAKIPAGPPGPPGQTGAQGLAGKDGAAGPAGKDADAAKLAAIEARLAAVEAKASLPIYIKKTNTVTGLPVGEVEAVHLGEGFEFRLTPHK